MIKITSTPVSFAGDAAPSSQAATDTGAAGTPPFRGILDQVASQPTPIASDRPPVLITPSEYVAPLAAKKVGGLGSPEMQNFIEWQGAQKSPFTPGTIADLWAMQGITDPLSDPVIIQNAKEIMTRAESRVSMDTGYKPEWQSDWKTDMALKQAAEKERQTLLAAQDAANGVVVG